MAISDADKNDGLHKRVRERLLDAAEELFCEHGFEGTTVRELATAAGCNIASVNYYFGGKDKLYVEVWRRHLVPMRQIRLASIEKVMSQSTGKPCLDDLLRSFANAFIGPLVDKSKSGRLLKLMARESLDQHLPADMFVQEVIGPTMKAMGQALMEVCPGLDRSKVPMVIFSIAGQLVHLVHFKATFDHADQVKIPTLDLNEAIDHIVTFSAAGVRAYTEGKTE